MKYEWRRQDKVLYGAKETPALVTIPAQNYIMLSGKGDPNDIDFSNRVGALYSLAYGVKSAYKAAPLREGIEDFAVYPLEGIWKKVEGDRLEKEKLKYTIMIRQPDFVTEDLVKEALEVVKRKSRTLCTKKFNIEPWRMGYAWKSSMWAHTTMSRCPSKKWTGLRRHRG